MSAPFGPKATATAEAGDLFMITRGSGAALEVEKVDPTDAATAALIAAGLDVLLGNDDWRSGGTGTGGSSGSPANTVLHGTGAPASDAGADGDFYIRTSDWTIWGPKTAGRLGITELARRRHGQQRHQWHERRCLPRRRRRARGRSRRRWRLVLRHRRKGDPRPEDRRRRGSGTSLTGATGSAGAAGATVNLRKSATHIEYQHVGDADWTELVALGDITGPAGATGSAGAAGAAGTNGTTLAGVNQQTGTSYALVLADAAKLVECANAAAITLTVPPNSSVAFPVNTVIHVAQAGAGQVTIAAGSGVTIKKHAAFNARTLGPEAVVSLAKTGTDSWRLFGLLEAA